MLLGHVEERMGSVEEKVENMDVRVTEQLEAIKVVLKLLPNGNTRTLNDICWYKEVVV